MPLLSAREATKWSSCWQENQGVTVTTNLFHLQFDWQTEKVALAFSDIFPLSKKNTSETSSKQCGANCRWTRRSRLCFPAIMVWKQVASHRDSLRRGQVCSNPWTEMPICLRCSLSAKVIFVNSVLFIYARFTASTPSWRILYMMIPILEFWAV